MPTPDVSEKPNAPAASTPRTGSADTYIWWIGVIMLMMACLVVCVLAGQGMSAVAFAIVIHAASQIQQSEANRDNPPNAGTEPLPPGAGVADKTNL